MSSVAFPAESCVVADVRPSPNHGERKDGQRPNMIVLHYTGMRDATAALDLLCARGSDVSAHYFVFEDGQIVQMVKEGRRAWHAGAGLRAGESDTNSCSIGIEVCSIGIEIANPGHEHGYPDFPTLQIAAVIALCRSIQTRHAVPPVRVLAHSDVAPGRKRDPGEKFPWRTLHDSGIGHWVKPAPITEGDVLALGDRGDAVAVNSNYDSAMHDAVAAFQRHFRPARIDGAFDESTRTTLRDVLAHRGGVRTMAARARVRDIAYLSAS
jgi:N-acetylmuramoyl-L-alanine amidase